MICKDLTREQSINLYHQVMNDNDTDAIRKLCREDLFFLLFIACRRMDVNRDWIYDRCREVESRPDECLDLWSRGHYKSTIITFGLTVQDILKDSNQVFGIFSHTRPIAKAFLAQIKREFETNTFLQDLFPEVLYKNPQKDSPKWSLDDGIIVKRKSNPKEATIEAWGLIDGQPTSKHYNVMIFDDVVTRESVTTPEQIKKTTEAWELSLNLASENCRKRYIGTRYHSIDTYKTMLDRKSAFPRIYPATDDGTLGGEPVLLDRETFLEKVRDLGSYTAACQLLMNPLADNVMGFREEWLERYLELYDMRGWNFYILVDSASEKKKTSDYTVIVCIGLAPDGNYYLVDGVRDRMNLTERTSSLFKMAKKWNPIRVGYEKYGLNSDIEHIKYEQELKNYRFHIEPLSGSMGKVDRIRQLVPVFENHRFYIPHRLMFLDVNGKVHDFIEEFIRDEYNTFPLGAHDDMLDAIARIRDEKMNAEFPSEKENVEIMDKSVRTRYDVLSTKIGPDDDRPYNPLLLSGRN